MFYAACRRAIEWLDGMKERSDAMSRRGRSNHHPDVNGMQPHLPFAGRDLAEVLESIRCERVAAAPRDIPIGFFEQKELAAITLGDHRFQGIGLHVLLNSLQTPLLLFKYIFTHELLHTVVPAREIKGKRVSHPPEFFEQEKMVTPAEERYDAWLWLWINFGGYLKRDKQREGMLIRRGWRSLLRHDRVDLVQCRSIVGPSSEIPDDAIVG